MGKMGKESRVPRLQKDDGLCLCTARACVCVCVSQGKLGLVSQHQLHLFFQGVSYWNLGFASKAGLAHCTGRP